MDNLEKLQELSDRMDTIESLIADLNARIEEMERFTLFYKSLTIFDPENSSVI